MRAKLFPIRTHLDWQIMYFHFFLLLNNVFLAELWRTKRACGAPWVSKSTHPRKFGKHVTDRLSNQPPRRKLIAHQCCHQLTAVKTGCPLTSIIWPYCGLRCRPTKVEYFWSYPLTIYSFSNDRRLTFTFFKNSYQICCVYVSIAPHYYEFDFNLTSDVKIQPVFWKDRRGRPLLTMVTPHVQFLCSDWLKFDRWVHAENLCSSLKVVYFDSWSWQRFESTCDVFSCLFPLDEQNEIQLLSRVFSYSWLVCLLGFWLRNASFVKIGYIRFRMASFLFFTLLNA